MRRTSYLAVGFLMNLMLGTAYAWSVFTGPLREGYGATDFEAMLPLAVSLAMFSVGMMFAGRLVDRHGPRKVAVLGGLLVGGGYMASFLMGQVPPAYAMPTLTATFGVVVGLGIGFAYNPPIPTAVRWFPDRKGLASGIVVMGFGLSALFTAPVASALIGDDPANVPTTFLVLGAVFLIGLVVLGSLLRFPPEDWVAPKPRTTPKRTWTPVRESTTREMVRTPAFWAVWAMYALGTAGGFMIIGKASPIAKELGGATPVLAILAVQVLAVFNSIGRPVFGRLADMHGVRRALLAMYLLLLAAMALLAVSSSYAPLALGIALTGMVFGGFLAVMPAVAAFFFGTKHLGTNYGVLFTGYGLGVIVALFAIGPLHDAFGTYTPAFQVGLAFGGLGLAIALLLKPPKPAVARGPPMPAVVTPGTARPPA